MYHGLIVGAAASLLAFSAIPAFAFAAPLDGYSENWAGYAATGGPFTSVAGSWVVPTVAASQSAEADATWVGIGGLSSTNDLIQVGTQALAQNGSVSYEAWYELLPANSVSIAFNVHAGDTMSASITETSSDEWQVTLDDLTTGGSFSQSLSYDSSESSAEWIEEMPNDQSGPIPLDNFGTVSFSDATTVDNGVFDSAQAAGAFPLSMITSTDLTLAAPSALGEDGESFSVTRASNQSTIAPRTVERDGRGGFRRGGGGTSGYVPHTLQQSYTTSRTQFTFHTFGFGSRLSRFR